MLVLEWERDPLLFPFFCHASNVPLFRGVGNRTDWRFLNDLKKELKA
jgi:hypothetical protein